MPVGFVNGSVAIMNCQVLLVHFSGENKVYLSKSHYIFLVDQISKRLVGNGSKTLWGTSEILQLKYAGKMYAS